MKQQAAAANNRKNDNNNWKRYARNVYDWTASFGFFWTTVFFVCKCRSVSHRMNQSQYWLVSEKERKDSRPTVAKQMFIDIKKKSPFGSHTHTDKQTNGQTDKKLKGIHPFIHSSIDQIGSTDGWCHMAIGRIIIMFVRMTRNEMKWKKHIVNIFIFFSQVKHQIHTHTHTQT